MVMYKNMIHKSRFQKRKFHFPIKVFSVRRLTYGPFIFKWTAWAQILQPGALPDINPLDC
ncbi:hypothetical protein SK128_000217 [Halocaridina rubra]|uniref:Uncharacterized protein n=1 Tax=Halocaridina rubra TaxID=373956 RepID=A0AAN8XSH8_HALRR